MEFPHPYMPIEQSHFDAMSGPRIISPERSDWQPVEALTHRTRIRPERILNNIKPIHSHFTSEMQPQF
jgi:hypothetical protein